MTIDVNGKEVLIDDEDYVLFNKYKWHIGSTGYVVWRGVKDGKKQTIRLHRLITNAPKGLVVDHLNHNPFDNRKANLRVCTQAENSRNKKDPGKGYWFNKSNGKWLVEFNGRYYTSYRTEEEAKKLVEHIRNGGTYAKPEKTHCKHGHEYSVTGYYQSSRGTRVCKPCIKRNCAEYFKRSYKPKPRKEIRYCPRGHDKRITRTNNGDCTICARERSKYAREKRNRIRENGNVKMAQNNE